MKSNEHVEFIFETDSSVQIRAELNDIANLEHYSVNSLSGYEVVHILTSLSPVFIIPILRIYLKYQATISKGKIEIKKGDKTISLDGYSAVQIKKIVETGIIDTLFENNDSDGVNQ